MRHGAYPVPHFPHATVPTRRASRLSTLLQFLFVAGTVVALIAAPPASGQMLLVPLDGGGRDGLARVAVNAGARLIGPGPLDGSLVVSGERAALVAALMPAHALVLNAAIGGCGERKNP